MCYWLSQEGEEKKEGEHEEKEQEKLGKLEFSLDYNFTDTQVGPFFTFIMEQWAAML